MSKRTLDPAVVPHHFADGIAYGGYDQWKEVVVDQPLTAAHLAALADENGHLRVNINVDYSQLLAGFVTNDEALPHYAPLVFAPELVPIVLDAAATADPREFGEYFSVNTCTGSSSLHDSHTGRPLLSVEGNFSAVLEAAGYGFVGWAAV